MFGTNTIHGRSTFKTLDKDQLMLACFPFATLQGEGPYSGQKAVFMRLAHCNLACSFCDTAFDKGDVYQFEDILMLLLRCVNDWNKQNNCKPQYSDEDLYKVNTREALLEGWGFVVTGGEPLLQQNLFKFLERLLEGYSPVPLFNWMQIESNGIPAIGLLHYNYHGKLCLDTGLEDDVTLVVSPKCAEKDGVAIKYIKPHRSVLHRADHLKFVVTADETSAYHTIPDWAIEWSKSTGRTVYVSPMNVYLREPQATLLAAKSNVELSPEERTALETISFWEEGLLDREQNRRNHEHAAKLCMKHNFILSLQTHLYASLP